VSKPKLWITRDFGNRISHRSLNNFEIRNPKMFDLSHRAHASWEEAHAHLVDQRMKNVLRATAALSSAVRALDGAQAMVRPDAKKDVVVATAKALGQ